MYDWETYGWHTVKNLEMRKILDLLKIDSEDPKITEALDTLRKLSPTAENLEALAISEEQVKQLTAMKHSNFLNLMLINALREGLLEIESRLDKLEESNKRQP